MITYEKMFEIKSEYPGLNVDNDKWYSSFLINIETYFNVKRISGNDIIKFFKEI